MKKKPAAPAPLTANIHSALPAGYPAFLEAIKSCIRAAQVRAALAASTELIRLYWSIGRDLENQFGTEVGGESFFACKGQKRQKRPKATWNRLRIPSLLSFESFQSFYRRPSHA